MKALCNKKGFLKTSKIHAALKILTSTCPYQARLQRSQWLYRTRETYNEIYSKIVYLLQLLLYTVSSYCRDTSVPSHKEKESEHC